MKSNEKMRIGAIDSEKENKVMNNHLDIYNTITSNARVSSINNKTISPFPLQNETPN